MTTQPMTTETKKTKAEASANRIHAKYNEAKAAYNLAHNNWLMRKDFASIDYCCAFRDLQPLKAEMNKWWGEYSKALDRIA